MQGVDFFWLASIVGLVIIEALAVNLISIWFAAGALCALIASLLGAEPWVAWAVFVLVSGITLAALRPFCKRFLIRKNVATNADRNIGEIAVCTERIDNIKGSGAVKISGIVWTARTLGGSTAEPGQTVRIEAIEGSKLVVTPVGQLQNNLR
ncbi:MAG: NfeD family protein [Oscillospiraceae bacterium]|nr:NfeD family protein [Oscillospiraceae bacterium]